MIELVEFCVDITNQSKQCFPRYLQMKYCSFKSEKSKIKDLKFNCELKIQDEKYSKINSLYTQISSECGPSINLDFPIH